MKFEYLATIVGGNPPDIWDREVLIFSENISTALKEVEKNLKDSEYVISICRHINVTYNNAYKEN